MPVNANIENNTSGLSLLSLSIIMDLSWINAWAVLLFSATTTLNFPFWTFCTLFITGYMISFFFKHSKKRRIWSVLFHISGWAIMFVCVLYNAGITAYPQTVSQWYAISLAAICTMFFWYRGAVLAFKNLSYPFACRHFDLGFSLFFTLFLIIFLVEIKGGINIFVPTCFYFMLIFILAGPTALFTSFHPKKSGGQFIEGFKGYGIFISAALFIVSACLIWGLVFHPFLTQMAQFSITVIQDAARPFASYFIALLRFLFGRLGQRNFEAMNRKNTYAVQGSNQMTESPWVEILFHILSVILFLIILMILGYILFKFFQWLMEKHPQKKEAREQHLFFKNILILLQHIIRGVKILIRNLTYRMENAAEGFLQLSLWGRRSGIPKKYDETPSEYCSRLGTHFKLLANDITIVQQAFIKEVYAKKRISQRDLSTVKAALKRMRLPGFWWIRIKSLFFYDGINQKKKI